MTPGNFTNSDGTVFQLARADGSEKLLHAFGSESYYSPTCLVAAGSVLYGATTYGGANGNGTIFKLTP